ncbi:MAG: hypothetical protein ACI4E5_06240 [Suilimivivens sp.]
MEKSMVNFFKSIVDQNRASVVICNLKHEIIYMNPAAVHSYEKRGGDKLIGKSLLECHNQESREKIQQVVDWFAADESHNIVYTFHNDKKAVVVGDQRQIPPVWSIRKAFITC